jgi:hypothetical protein
MLKRPAVFTILFVLGGIFAAGLLHLFQLRFSQGDIYAPYSSLRADPLGSKAFFASLDRISSVSVQRSFEPLSKLGSGKDRTVLFLGVAAFDLNYESREELRALEQFMSEGGRVVVTLVPEVKRTWWSKTRANVDAGRKKNRRMAGGKEEEPGEWVPLQERWKFSVSYLDLELDDHRVAKPETVTSVSELPDLPGELSWHSAIYFSGLSDDWQPVYSRGKNAVIVERPFGRGSLVLASDSYFTSNEAMRNERHPALLAWLLGANANIIFDEFHLGVQHEPGIAELARKYRLHGFVLGLLMLAGLFIWKNSTSFIPPAEEEMAAVVVQGKDSAAGFVNLLRRNVPPREILAVCFGEWRQACAHSRRDLAARAEKAQEILVQEQNRPARERNPVATYDAICRILNQRP